MKIISSELEQIAAIISQYPDSNLKEVAFAGRSNVGKSSFINAFINRKNLARTSSKPGKTRTVNFYKINNSFRLVDLPGYGYAQVSKSEKEKWGVIIETYLSNRENLCEVILIVDIRHAPSKEDVMMYNWLLEYGFSGYVIATKRLLFPPQQITFSKNIIFIAINLRFIIELKLVLTIDFLTCFF